MATKHKIGITAGDINGIGFEIVLKAFSNALLFDTFIPLLYATPQVFKFYKELLNLNEPMYKIVKDEKDIEENKINLRIINQQDVKIEPGVASKEAGKYALESIKMAIEDVKNGWTEILLTMPIDKKSIYSDEFKFEGHTGYLANAFETKDYMMLLSSDTIKVGLVTEHLPIKDVAQKLSIDGIYNKVKTLHETLRVDFGIVKPKIAVLALNPHAGDGGVIGDEEIKIIIPAIKKLYNEDKVVLGPYSADGFFGNRQYTQFDAVVAMYHDQGLIPFKYIAFDQGINFTCGLPIIRTSPDHGVAYDIAGKNIADIASFLNAMYEGIKLLKTRKEYYELNKLPLPFTKFRREKFSIGIPNIPKRED